MKLLNLPKHLFSRTPTHAVFFVTLKCNSRCSWCNAWKNSGKKELNLKQIKKILIKLKKFGICFLYFSGGEPLLRKDILDIIKTASDLGFEQMLVTNGILLDGRIIHHLVKIPLLHINVSLDALDRKLYKQIRGLDALNRVVKNIKLFKKLHPHYPLRATMTVSSANLNQVEKVYRFCQKNKIYFSPNPYFDVGRFRKYNQIHDYSKCKKKLINYYQKISLRTKTESFLSGFPIVYQKLVLWLKGKLKEPCGAGQEIIFVNPKGKVYACQDLEFFADLSKQSLAKKWQEKTWLKSVKKCYQETPCFTFCTRSPYILKHNKIRVFLDLLTSKKILHYFKMY